MNTEKLLMMLCEGPDLMVYNNLVISSSSSSRTNSSFLVSPLDCEDQMTYYKMYHLSSHLIPIRGDSKNIGLRAAYVL